MPKFSQNQSSLGRSNSPFELVKLCNASDWSDKTHSVSVLIYFISFPTNIWRYSLSIRSKREATIYQRLRIYEALLGAGRICLITYILYIHKPTPLITFHHLPSGPFLLLNYREGPNIVIPIIIFIFISCPLRKEIKPPLFLLLCLDKQSMYINCTCTDCNERYDLILEEEQAGTRDLSLSVEKLSLYSRSQASSVN